MPETIQCTNCGAILADEDIFCGECGAPHPLLEPGAEVPAAPTPPAQAAAPPPPARPAPPPYKPPRPAQPARSSKTGWEIAFIILGIVGMLCCLAGIAATLFGGSVQSEGLSPEQNWLYSVLICLLPIGGTGAILILAAAAIWFIRLKER